jgi:hypothetical protein
MKITDDAKAKLEVEVKALEETKQQNEKRYKA